MGIIVGSTQDRTPEGVLRALDGETTTLTMGAALGLLPDLDAPQDAKEAAVAGLVERARDPAVVTGALHVLGRLGGARALDVLREQVRGAQDGRALAEAALSLGWAGQPDDLRLLLDATERLPPGLARDRTVIGSWLLVHRHGLADQLPGYPGNDAEDLELVSAGEELVAAPTDRSGPGLDQILRQGTWPLPDDPRAAGGFSCAGQAHVVVTAAAALAESARRPLLAAVVVAEAVESRVPTVRYVVLTRPGGGDGALDVLVTTTTGELVLRGRGRVDATSARVELRAVSAPGAVAVEVTVDVALSADGGATAVSVAGRSDLVATTSRTPTPAAPTASTPTARPADGAAS